MRHKKKNKEDELMKELFEKMFNPTFNFILVNYSLKYLFFEHIDLDGLSRLYTKEETITKFIGASVYLTMKKYHKNVEGDYSSINYYLGEIKDNNTKVLIYELPGPYTFEGDTKYIALCLDKDNNRFIYQTEYYQFEHYFTLVEINRNDARMNLGVVINNMDELVKEMKITINNQDSVDIKEIIDKGEL